MRPYRLLVNGFCSMLHAIRIKFTPIAQIATATTMTQPSEKTPLSPDKKLLLDLAPVLIFFISYRMFDLMTATAVLVVASLISLAISYYVTRALSYPVLIGASMITVFGVLTLALNDETFIKIRPTIVNGLFAVTLLGGALIFKKGLLKFVFEIAFTLSDEGWRVLSMRWGAFFAVLAVLNEIVWRTQTEAFWVNYKVFGAFGLTMLFAISQMKVMEKYKI
jgi:intracellular septation protein